MTTSLYTGAARYVDGIPVVPSTAARNARYPTPPAGFRVHNLETRALEIYESGAWVTADSFGSAGAAYVDASRMTGANWGAKVSAALDVLPATGGIVDAHGITGSEALTGTLTLDVPYLTLLVSSAMTLSMSTFGIVVPVATHGVRLLGQGFLGARTQNGAYPEGAWSYAGTGNAITVGDSSAATKGFAMEDIGIWLGAAGDAAVGVDLNYCHYADFVRLLVLGKLGGGTPPDSRNIGVSIDGTGSFSGWIGFRHCILNRCYQGIVGTNVVNAVTILGGAIGGRSASIVGSAGIVITSGANWSSQNVDIDQFEHGVHLDAAYHNTLLFRGENNTLDAYLTTNAYENDILCTHGLSGFTDLGRNNYVRGEAGKGKPAEELLGRQINANMNSTADQPIRVKSNNFRVTRVMVTNASISLTTAAGGVYTAASKGGTAIVAAGQVYSALTAAAKVLDLTIASSDRVTTAGATVNVYLSLTTAQGVAATADVYVYGVRLD